MCSTSKIDQSYLTKRQKVNDETKQTAASVSVEIADSLALIQQIAVTRPSGTPACMGDWNNTSTVEHGMMSMAKDAIGFAPQQPLRVPEYGVYISRNSNKTFPIIMDQAYFEPGRQKRPNFKFDASESYGQILCKLLKEDIKVADDKQI